MNAFDFNIHLVKEPDQDKDFNIADHDFTDRLIQTKELILESNLSGANICVLDPRVVEEINRTRVQRLSSKEIYLTLLIDPLSPDSEERISRAKELGFRGIKFHPYQQNLTPETYKDVRTCARAASRNGLWITICGSYGTTKLYDVNAVELLVELSQCVNSPLILLHSGGKRILDAMSVALEQSHVFLETSFSLSFWRGSSVEQDLAFAFKKLGGDRVIYGSDHPYIPINQSLELTHEFFERFNFETEFIEKVLSTTARDNVLN
jgi:predicted TIM-barrel fold metal-dependent hydrolase